MQVSRPGKKAYAMSKERKTARELEDMIRAELNDPSVSVSVRPSKEVGWVTVTSTWFGAPIEPRRRMDQIAARLRAQYDLKED
jgi:predicted transcriptional regulator